jgi:hypothetical protein
MKSNTFPEHTKISHTWWGSFKFVAVLLPTAARGGQVDNCPQAPAGGAPKEGGKKFFDDGTSEGGDRGVSRGLQLSYSWIS